MDVSSLAIRGLLLTLLLGGCAPGGANVVDDGDGGGGTATGATGGGTNPGGTSTGGTSTGGGTGTATGGGGQEPTCDDAFRSCGGDPTGDWDIVALCDVDLDPADIGCPSASYEILEDRSEGRIVFDAEGTYQRRYDVDLDFRILVPTECTFGVDCATIEAFSKGFFDGCETVADGCGCTGTLSTTDEADGTWEMDGDTLITDGVDRTEVCIRGDFGMSVDPDDVRAIWAR